MELTRSIMVVRLILVQFVGVRILPGQQRYESENKNIFGLGFTRII